jgi:fermentation-respiration switch protein FrsA (DUF1100 family)
VSELRVLTDDREVVVPDTRHRRPALAVAAAVAGVAVAIVVARDGEPVWQLVRGGGVVAAAGFVSWALQVWPLSIRHGAAALVLGLASSAVGVGIGAPHVAKDGPLVITVAGVVAGAAGVVLLIGGIVSMTRARRGWRRFAIAPPAIVVSLVTLWCLGFSIAATNVPRTAVGSTTPADHGVAFDDVTFRTADDVLLSGWYIPSANGAAVVLLHGAGSTRSGVLDHAVVLARHGYGVLLFDARGHGRSAGRAMDFGWYGDLDTDGAIGFLADAPGTDPDRIAAIGLSMGGEEALGAFAANARIRSVIAEGATNRVAADKAWLVDEHGWRGAIQRGIDTALYAMADLLTAAEPPVTLRRAVELAAPRRALLIAGGAVPDEVAAARHIQAGSPSTVDVWEVPGTGHTDALATHHDDWASRVTAFLADTIGG